MAHRISVHTRKTLYHLLPVVFWLLAISGMVLFYREWQGYAVAGIVLACLLIMRTLKPRSSSVEQYFCMAVLLGIASYWLPSVVLLTVPGLIYLYYRRLSQWRDVAAMWMGFALVAVWIGVLTQLSIIHYPLSISYNLFAWIPTGALLCAHIASTIARRILHVR